ncbi:MAG: FAD-dependent oxidoreductase, partial [Flavobacteriaceae bacterium]
SEEEVVKLVKKRWDGIQLMRATLGDQNIDFQNNGGHELFMQTAHELYEKCMGQLAHVNSLLNPIFEKDPFVTPSNTFGFRKIHDRYISHIFEGQLDTGLMMETLLEKVRQSGVMILNAITVQEFADLDKDVTVKTSAFEFKTKKLLVATNGFAAQLIDEDVKPARAQVLITKPIPDLHIKGTFHFDEGYYYFRNIDNRILFGGGRNLDFKAEETTEFGQTKIVQDQLKTLLQQVILPKTPFEIERSWSGIMGVGTQKRPIIKQLSTHVFCGVRLGGMGIAIGSAVGKELADLV